MQDKVVWKKDTVLNQRFFDGLKEEAYKAMQEIYDKLPIQQPNKQVQDL